MNAVLTFDSARGRRMSGTEPSRGAIGPGGRTVIPFHPAPAALVSPAEPAPRPERLARLIYMASVGGYMAVRGDTLVQLDGRMVWPTADALIRDAAAAGVPVSSHVINTARS